MKVKISVLALIAILFLGLTAANALAANSFNFLGETTWTVTINEREIGPIPAQTITMTGAISKLGPNNYYLFQGSAQIPGDNPFFLAGSGVLVGGKLVMTLTTSQQHVDVPQVISNRDTGVMHVELNPDLSGTFYEVGHDFDKVSQHFSERFTAGSLSVPNPTVPLSPNTGSQLPLLLE